MRMEELRGAAPASTCCPQRGLPARLRSGAGQGGDLWMVTADPSPESSRPGRKKHRPGVFPGASCTGATWVAFLASHEETLRALDAVRAGVTVVSEETRGHRGFSRSTIARSRAKSCGWCARRCATR